MALSHNYYQPKSVTIHTRQLGRRNWAWRICGYFFEEIATGDGCRTKARAREIATEAKLKYLASVSVLKVELHLKSKKKQNA
jgi:hypothetical protein